MLQQGHPGLWCRGYSGPIQPLVHHHCTKELLPDLWNGYNWSLGEGVKTRGQREKSQAKLTPVLKTTKSRCFSFLLLPSDLPCWDSPHVEPCQQSKACRCCSITQVCINSVPSVMLGSLLQDTEQGWESRQVQSCLVLTTRMHALHSNSVEPVQ